MSFLSKDLLKLHACLVFTSRTLPRVGLKLTLSGCRSGSMATACALKYPSRENGQAGKSFSYLVCVLCSVSRLT